MIYIFSFIGFYCPKEFKDTLRTIEPQFPKNLRTNEARSDFTGPYKKKSVTSLLFGRASFVSKSDGVINLKPEFGGTGTVSLVDKISSFRRIARQRLRKTGVPEYRLRPSGTGSPALAARSV